MRRATEEVAPKRLFAGRSFYFDLRYYPQMRPQLTNGIKALGGKIEEFLPEKEPNLRKEGLRVTRCYVVTDKPKKDWPPKEGPVGQTSAPSPCLGLGPTAVDANNQLSNSSTSLSSMTTFPGNGLNKGDPVVASSQSQGWLNLAKVGTGVKNQMLIPALSANHFQANGAIKPVLMPSRDVCVTATGRGMKLLYIQDMLDFCHKHVPVGDKARDDQQTKQGAKVLHLVSPFIKVEDEEAKYRPFWKEMQSGWPDLKLDSPTNGSPFVSRAKVGIKPTLSQPVKPYEGLAVHSNKDLKTPTLTVKRDDKSVPKKPPVKRKAPQYCEICGFDYDGSINEHIKTEKHDSYARNENNYKELMNVIRSLPKLSDILTEKEREDQEERLEREEQKKGDDRAIDNRETLILSPPSASPSTPSTTITLTSGTTRRSLAGGGTFIHLHELMKEGKGSAAAIYSPQTERRDDNDPSLCPEGHDLTRDRVEQSELSQDENRMLQDDHVSIPNDQNSFQDKRKSSSTTGYTPQKRLRLPSEQF